MLRRKPRRALHFTRSNALSTEGATATKTNEPREAKLYQHRRKDGVLCSLLHDQAEILGSNTNEKSTKYAEN